MNLKIKLMLAAALTVAAVGSVRAELYSASIRWDVQNAKIGEADANFMYAMFKVNGVPGAYLFGTETAMGQADMLFSEGMFTDGTPSNSTGPDHTSLFANNSVSATVDYRDLSYYVELYDGSAELFARSVTTWSYDDLGRYVHQGGSAMGSAADVLTVSAFTAVPEPTTGLLVLVGAALLGLKRKQI